MAERQDEDDEVGAALQAIRSAEGPALSDIITLVEASLEREVDLLPRPVIDAVLAKVETDGDFANGGADQFAWNHGVEPTRTVAGALRAVGAIENADLLDRLAGELAAYLQEIGPGDDAVRRFLGYRARVGGPFFRVPSIDEELAEALVEYVIAHAPQ